MLSSIRFALRHGAIGSMFMYQRSAAVSTYRACSPTSSQEPTCIPAAQRKAAAERHQVPASQLHFEQFILEDKSGEAFTLVLARSGREFTVPQDMTILQVIENNKAAKVECLCREGVCGTCETMILEGEADHRDQYYSEEEKASQQSMLICCSRAKGGRLVLDL